MLVRDCQKLAGFFLVMLENMKEKMLEVWLGKIWYYQNIKSNNSPAFVLRA